LVGEGRCAKPYKISILNISAMSFGALSGNAIEALNIGAREGGFAHNTGEGSITPYHLQGGDLIWQIGTGYFGCRTPEGGFDPNLFAERASLDVVKMIEIKISQGAKPGHGGILPAAKITPEISRIREVPMGADVVSPPAHSEFSTPVGLLEFVTRLRELSGGKPVGFKLCIGKRREFLAICKAMIETGLRPDFITVDGGEGGTGAAPFEFSNSLGCPLVDGLTFVHNSLVGSGLRDEIRIAASGKISSGFGLTRMLALGADFSCAARSMMLSLGCIQARRCNSNECPVGVATQNAALSRGLVVESKAPRVARYHAETIHAAVELMGAAGLASPEELRPWHITRRVSQLETRHYGEIVEYLKPGALLRDPLPTNFSRAWRSANASSFAHVEGVEAIESGADGTALGENSLGGDAIARSEASEETVRV
jgi:glutamate synthase domain-containing protein 2